MALSWTHANDISLGHRCAADQCCKPRPRAWPGLTWRTVCGLGAPLADRAQPTSISAQGALNSAGCIGQPLRALRLGHVLGPFGLSLIHISEPTRLALI
eukprot:11780108-Alexandrium_andersonii.AAC.1